YVLTIPAESMSKVFMLLGVTDNDRQVLLQTLAKRFHENDCFSAIGKFLDQNNIKHQTFTWA
ncbi:MAG: hypothetical protein L0Y76_02675, partial [Ignavibacteria bacterium]|nr:hypothetical protein [Ignavibacteria bacterium]